MVGNTAIYDTIDDDVHGTAQTDTPGAMCNVRYAICDTL